MRVTRALLGVLFCLAGLYLILLEVAMAIGESHALRGSAVFVFMFVVLVAFGLAYVGYRLLRD